jgi:hypothetical protein
MAASRRLQGRRPLQHLLNLNLSALRKAISFSTCSAVTFGESD